LLPLALSLVYNAGRRSSSVPATVSWCRLIGRFPCTFSSVADSQPPGIEDSDRSAARSISQTADRCSISNVLRKISLTAFFILFCGASIPITEKVFPQKYIPPAPAAQVQLSNDSQLIQLNGRAILPRWYAAEMVNQALPSLATERQIQNRLVFFLVG